MYDIKGNRVSSPLMIKWILGIGILIFLFAEVNTAKWWNSLDTGKVPIPVNQYSAKAQAMIQQACAGLEGQVVIDYHCHILGTGANHSGNYVNPKMQSWKHPVEYIRFWVYTKASGINDISKVEDQYLQKLLDQIKVLPYHSKFALLAFDEYYDSLGNVIPEKSEFHISNDYVFSVAAKYPEYFLAVMSIHPYRKDAVAALRKYAALGGKMVKWLPNAMGINPANPICDSFYAEMKRNNLVLLSHGGEEQAVEAEEDQALGNPLLLKRALDAGVRVVVAHCASLGKQEMHHAGGASAEVSNFDVFCSMLKEEKYKNLLYGDLSAVAQYNRCDGPLQLLLNDTLFNGRLVHGSDYPLTAIDVVIQTGKLRRLGMITKEEEDALDEIFASNPILFEFVLKRMLHAPVSGKKFPKSVFVSGPLQ